jgi:hypothetical protein
LHFCYFFYSHFKTFLPPGYHVFVRNHITNMMKYQKYLQFPTDEYRKKYDRLSTKSQQLLRQRINKRSNFNIVASTKIMKSVKYKTFAICNVILNFNYLSNTCDRLQICVKSVLLFVYEKWMTWHWNPLSYRIISWARTCSVSNEFKTMTHISFSSPPTHKHRTGILFHISVCALRYSFYL